MSSGEYGWMCPARGRRWRFAAAPIARYVSRSVVVRILMWSTPRAASPEMMRSASPGCTDADSGAFGRLDHLAGGRRVLTCGVARRLEIRAGDQQPRSDPCARINLAPPGEQFLEITADVSDCGHARGNQQRQRRATRLRDVGVHVDQAGDQKAPASVDDLRVWRRRKRGGRPDVCDAIAAHEYRAAPRRLLVHRQDRNVADQELVRRHREPHPATEAGNGDHGGPCTREYPAATRHSGKSRSRSLTTRPGSLQPAPC